MKSSLFACLCASIGALTITCASAQTIEDKLAAVSLLVTSQPQTERPQDLLTPIIPAGSVETLTFALKVWGERFSIRPIDPIDVIILGDGYMQNERRSFMADIDRWYADFSCITPYQELQGAFRVRGYWTPSQFRAGPERKSFYQFSAVPRVPINNAKAQPPIFNVDDKLGKETVTRIVNLLTTIQDSQHNHFNRSGHAGAVLVMLVKADAVGTIVSGFTTRVETRFGTLPMAIAADDVHEFTHALANLGDEYITEADRRADDGAKQRMLANANDLWLKYNCSYSCRKNDLPWSHLAPGTDMNPDPDSVIGLPWIGGNAEYGVWHSEPFCRMNGSHNNWDLAHQYRGASLRTRNFCFWCEEIVTAKILALTGMLGDDLSGTSLWQKWLQQRSYYQQIFKVKDRIQKRNADYKRQGLGNSLLIDHQ